MNKKTIYAFYTFVVLFLVLCFVTAYIFNVRSMNSNLKEKKMAFVEIVKLPDLAISTGATFVRQLFFLYIKMMEICESIFHRLMLFRTLIL